MKMEKIAIIGAGAVGCGLGFLLNRAGREVTLIGRADQVEVLRTKGLRVEGYAGEHQIKIPAVERLDFKPDLVLLAVKTQDVVGALRENLAYLTGATVVTMQNGVRSDDLVAGLLPQERIISAVVLLHANYLAPGSVTLMYEGGLIVGRPFGPRDPLLEETAQLLNQATPTRISDNIRGAHWLKLITNLNNALPALIDGTFHQVYADPFLASLAIRIMREGLKTAQKGRHPPGIPAGRIGRPHPPDQFPAGQAGRQGGGGPGRTDEDPLAPAGLHPAEPAPETLHGNRLPERGSGGVGKKDRDAHAAEHHDRRTGPPGGADRDVFQRG